jgi:hypothetical protein
MYSSYQRFVKQMLSSTDFSFKNNGKYHSILEHVSVEQGNSYISLIKNLIAENRFEITFENINDYLLLNDKYGSPVKSQFTYDDNNIECSPTSLRYILHSLLILTHIKNNTTSTKIVEVGCGYGGLFLAINHFSQILNIKINKYYFIDLPEISKLIERYLNLHENEINIKYSIHSAENYGNDINDNDLFFISNYCFTEIDNVYRNNYINHLFPKVLNGFIIWQTVFNLPIENVNIIGKEIKNIVEEYPQTANIINKNYYVYF